MYLTDMIACLNKVEKVTRSCTWRMIACLNKVDNVTRSGSSWLMDPKSWELLMYAIIPTMADLYVIYRYVISKWRSITPVEISQYDITMATLYDITVGNDVARDAHCKSQCVMMLLGLSIVMSQWVMTLLYVHIISSQCIMMLLWTFSIICILCSMPNYVILLWVVWNKKKNKFMFDQSGLENIRCFCVGLFYSSFGLVKYPYTNTTCVLPRMITYLFL